MDVPTATVCWVEPSPVASSVYVLAVLPVPVVHVTGADALASGVSTTAAPFAKPATGSVSVSVTGTGGA